MQSTKHQQMKNAKTDLMRILQHSFNKAANEKGLNETTIHNSRRAFLKKSMAGLTGLSLSTQLANASTFVEMTNDAMAPKIAILGAGVAGLHAAYILQKQGIKTTIYEASNRTGGRMYTAKNLLGNGITTELGGEFIDSIHDDILQLASEFNLPLIDTEKDKNLIKQIFYFNGKKYTADDLVQAFLPFVEDLKADINGLPEEISYKRFGDADKWDKMSIADYIDAKGIKGWLKKLLNIAFTTEYGLDITEQSAINFLFLFDPSKTTDLFGESDERYKIEGGNQRIVDELAKRLKPVKLSHELIKVKSKNDGYSLTFSNKKTAYYDYVICAIPFTKLRTVKLDINNISSVKKKCIQELGYGRNAKMFAGFNERFWRKQGASGQTFSDQPFQLGWDSSQLQKGKAGGYTFLTGGKMSDAMKNLPVGKKVLQYISQLNKIFPGVSKHYNGKNGIFYWPTHPHTLASYACYKVGQWTSIGGAESEPIGNLLFAGEHCSIDFQGYMNGGAETGRVAAETLIQMLK